MSACAVRVCGAGAVSALGVGVGAVRDAVRGGREFAAFQGPTGRSASYPAPFDPQRDLPRGLGRRLGRQLAMSLAAVLEATSGRRGRVQGAASDDPENPVRAWDEDPSETGLFAATAHGPIHETVDFIAGAKRNGARYASPLLFSGAQHNCMVGVVARELGVRGPAMVVVNGEVSFETALLAAIAGLRTGRMRRAIVVGADAFHELYAQSLARCGLLTRSAEPVDPAMRRTTRGFHLGEGAGALFLERTSPDAAGVLVDDVTLGTPVPRRGNVSPTRVELLASGDTESVRRHERAIATLGVEEADVAWPVARFGAFASLSAVAVAVEAARRLSSGSGDAWDGAAGGGTEGPTLFVSAPWEASVASVTLLGRGDGGGSA